MSVGKIYESWNNNQVLSLVSFNVKGAYNDVAKDILLEKLRERQVPTDIIRWVDASAEEEKQTFV